MKYHYHQQQFVTQLPDNQIFVFGSNLAGQHLDGMRHIAYQYFGAVQGVGRGWAGQSFAIATQNEHLQAMPLDQIAYYIQDFKIYTQHHPQTIYFITEIACDNTGYRADDIAPLFRNISTNVILPICFRPFLED